MILDIKISSCKEASMGIFFRRKTVSVQTIRRLPQYLRILKQWHAYGREMASSTELSGQTHLPVIVVKKDLQAVQAPSKRRAGFLVQGTIKAIEKFLGWNNLSKAFLVGAGHLGGALLGFDGLKQHGLEIVAAFDTNAKRVGTEIHGVPVYHTTQLKTLIEEKGLKIAVLTVPGSAAQGITDTLVACGIKAIWNFAPVRLIVPPGVVVQQEDIAAGLAELCSKLQ